MTLDDTACAATPGVRGFGGKRRGTDTLGLNARGTRAHIEAPAANFELDHSHAGAARVAAESYVSGESGKGMMQVGFARTRELPIDDCGGRTNMTHYWEYKVALAGAPLHCAWLDGTPVHFGQSKLYTVFRKVQSAETPNTTTWEARIEGVKKLAVNVRFDGADAVVASGELIRSSPPFGPVKGGLDACYGCSGSTAYPTTIQWQMTTAAGSSQWTGIAEGDVTATLNTDGKWVIGDIPTWAVHHPYEEY